MSTCPVHRRAAIVVLGGDGIGTNETMSRTGRPETRVWHWQERIVGEGSFGLLRNKTRPSRVKPLAKDVAEHLVALTLHDFH